MTRVVDKRGREEEKRPKGSLDATMAARRRGHVRLRLPKEAPGVFLETSRGRVRGPGVRQRTQPVMLVTSPILVETTCEGGRRSGDLPRRLKVLWTVLLLLKSALKWVSVEGVVYLRGAPQRPCDTLGG